MWASENLVTAVLKSKSATLASDLVLGIRVDPICKLRSPSGPGQFTSFAAFILLGLNLVVTGAKKVLWKEKRCLYYRFRNGPLWVERKIQSARDTGNHFPFLFLDIRLLKTCKWIWMYKYLAGKQTPSMYIHTEPAHIK
ncbi:hypothetical protein B0H13DRAFT_1904341 [Mycena leptocephala]|nr:hypothetical protein B0H13DRAFT_1904341 [Mycena leptocephala]